MKSFISPTPEELAQRIRNGVEAHYAPIVKSIEGDIRNSQNEIQNYTQNLASLTDRRDEISSDLDDLNQQLSSIATKRSTYPARFESARRYAAEKRTQVDSAQSVVQRAESNVDYAKNLLNSLREPIDDGRYEQELKQYEGQVAQIDSRIDDIKRDLKTVRQDQLDVSRKINSLSDDDATERLRLQQEERRLKGKESHFERQIDDLQNNKALLTKPVDDGHYKRELEHYRAEKERFENDVNSAESNLSSAERELKEAKRELESAENDVDRLIEEPDQLAALERRLPGEISDTEDSLGDVNERISDHQREIGQWKQELARQNAKKQQVQAEWAADARAKSSRFLHSSHGQTVQTWHRITSNMARNREIWEDCIKQVASQEDQMWGNRVLSKYANAYKDLKAEKAVNERNRAQAHGALDSQQRQVANIVESFLQQDKRNRWALAIDENGRHDVFKSGEEVERVSAHLNNFGSDPDWASKRLVAVRTKPMVALWILLALTILFVALALARIEFFGLGPILACVLGAATFGTLVYHAIAKSQGTNVVPAEQQMDWPTIAQSLRNSNNAVARFEQKAQEITAQSKKIKADNTREVAQIRARTTVADVAPHIDGLVPGFCVFDSGNKSKLEQFCALVVKGYTARGASNEELKLSASAFPIPPKVPYVGDDEFVKKAVSQFERKKVS